jgi:hypothetical protein
MRPLSPVGSREWLRDSYLVQRVGTTEKTLFSFGVAGLVDIAGKSRWASF